MERASAIQKVVLQQPPSAWGTQNELAATPITMTSVMMVTGTNTSLTAPVSSGLGMPLELTIDIQPALS